MTKKGLKPRQEWNDYSIDKRDDEFLLSQMRSFEDYSMATVN